MLKYWSLYLPREFTAISITSVYITPSANTKDAPSTLYQSVSMMQNANPDCVYFITGDFNQANLRSILPNYYQHVDFATMGEDTLDRVYTYI